MTRYIKICLILFLILSVRIYPVLSGDSVNTGAAANADDDFDAEFDEPPSVEIPTEIIQKLGIKTEKVVKKRLYRTITAPAEVMYNETNLYTINTKVQGWIERLYVNYTGRYVKKGEPIAEIYSPALVSAQQDYLSAHNLAVQEYEGEFSDMIRADAQRILESAGTRLKFWDITDGQIDALLKTKEIKKTMTLYSPANGYVIKKSAVEGVKVMPGMELFHIADLSDVWIIADIYEFDLPLIKERLPANITLDYMPGKKYVSGVDYIYPEVDAKTRTVKVRFPVSNADLKLRPMMYSKIMIDIDVGKRLVIPENAVIDDGTRKIVFLEKEKGIYEPREIVSGLKIGNYYEVVKGLREGWNVVTSANFLLDSEAQLKGVKPVTVD